MFPNTQLAELFQVKAIAALHKHIEGGNVLINGNASVGQYRLAVGGVKYAIFSNDHEKTLYDTPGVAAFTFVQQFGATTILDLLAAFYNDR